MTVKFQQSYFEPPYEEWSAILQAGAGLLRTASWAEMRLAARREVLERASAYTTKIDQLLGNANQPIKASEIGSWILAGHQPDLPHCGILAKYAALESLALERQATALNIIIDSDLGDLGEMKLPDLTSSTPRVRRLSLGSGPGLFLSQTVGQAEVLQELKKEVLELLTAQELVAVKQGLESYLSAAGLLVGKPLVEANTALRRKISGFNQFLELPLSELVSTPTIQSWLVEQVKDSQRLVAVYNETLNAFRKEHKIKNAANPFPNLAVDGSFSELPFWIIKRCQKESQPKEGQPEQLERRALLVNTDDSSLWLKMEGEPLALNLTVGELAQKLAICSELKLIPRGMLITAVFRLFLADLFIHGRGGANYEPAVEQFIQNYLEVPAAPFVIASATNRLFPIQLEQLNELEKLPERIRYLRSNPQELLKLPDLDDAQRSAVETLLTRKQDLLRQLQEIKTSGGSAKELGAAIKGIESDLGTLLEQLFAGDLTRLKELPQSYRSVVESREYPFFLWSSQ